MGSYYTSIICENGHLVDAYSSGNNSQNKFCRKCGSKTITTCPNCSTSIRGEYNTDIILDLTPYEYVPSYCHNCGSPYPWTKSALESARLLIEEDENLSPDEKQQFRDALPDLVVESPTPKTQVAATRFKKLIGKATSYTADGLKNILVEVVSEVIKKSIGL